MVLVLNTGSIIDPEASAMLGALHSRSIGGIRSHLKVLAEKGAENFMSKFYVGYGHKSIGDMGSITIFIEGISMLAAKAIQDHRLYNGQEASTRYIDFAHQPFIDPLGTEASMKVLEDWRRFYLHGLDVLPPYLKEKYQMETGEVQGVYDKAILARAFDIMRAFLPAGASTNLAWHGPVRVIADRLPILRNHPLAEIKSIARALETALIQAHPSSFSDKKYDTQEAYLTETVPVLAYLSLTDCSSLKVTRDTFDRAYLKRCHNALATRPAKTELPKFLDDAGEMQFEYLLDFGSFRDIQRHRAVIQRMPLLTLAHGFERWYLDEMPESLRVESVAEIARQTEAIKALGASPEVQQYYIAMGFRTANRITGTLPALTYLVELRSGSTVHPTLRILAQRMGSAIELALKETGFKLHLDMSENRFDVKRGTHDIVLK
jgi:thymidylate synthase ThyX